MWNPNKILSTPSINTYNSGCALGLKIKIISGFANNKILLKKSINKNTQKVTINSINTHNKIQLNYVL